jgi:hypothetical protein
MGTEIAMILAVILSSTWVVAVIAFSFIMYYDVLPQLVLNLGLGNIWTKHPVARLPLTILLTPLVPILVNIVFAWGVVQWISDTLRKLTKPWTLSMLAKLDYEVNWHKKHREINSQQHNNQPKEEND